MNFDQYRNEADINTTFKSQSINELLDSITGCSRIKTVQEKTCVTCSNVDVSFKDELSVIEYSISGMCQTCQDDYFEE